MQPDEAKIIAQFLVKHMEREHGTTLKVLTAVPATTSGYKPDPKSMSAMDLVWHIAAAEQYFMTGAYSGTFPSNQGRPESIKTPEDVVAWYKEEFPRNLERVKQMTGEELARDVDFHGVFSQPAVGYLQLMMSHSVHHRGQLSAYLRPCGGKVPGIYGPSGDEPLPAAATKKAEA